MMSDDLPANERPTSSTLTRQGGFAWGGVTLIGIGLVFLLRQMGLLPDFFNWWALFILLPAVVIYYRAWQTYRESERFDRRVRRMVTVASVILIVALIFLFDLNWGVMWPVILIAVGAGALLNSMR